MLITNPRLLTPFWDVTQHTVALTAVDQIVAGANPDRISLHFVGATAGTVILRPDQPATTTIGYQIVTPGRLEVNYTESGPLCSRDWHGITTGAGQVILVVEVIFRPQR